MKAVAIDTNVVIDLLNGKKPIIQRLQKFNIVYLPVTVSGELLFGAKNSQRRTANLEIFRNFVGTCEN
jgi:tRNA(fMet)-specific endonuclease VapC